MHLPRTIWSEHKNYNFGKFLLEILHLMLDHLTPRTYNLSLWNLEKILPEICQKEAKTKAEKVSFTMIVWQWMNPGGRITKNLHHPLDHGLSHGCC